MKYISSKEKEAVSNDDIGGKAKNLFRLLKLGMNVPEFIVIPQDVLQSLLSKDIAHNNRDEIGSEIAQINISAGEIEEIINEFPGVTYFAVRSSAIDEDGEVFSFAGQFESFLFVTKHTLADRIKDVWKSAFSDRVFQYRKTNQINQKFSLAIIVQRMIDAESSGVAFGINPVNGNADEKMISSVFGLGEGIVSGELNADNFIVSNKKLTTQLAEKTHKIVAGANGSTQKVVVEKKQQTFPSLTNKQVFELSGILDKLLTEYKKPQDIEFAFKDNQLYILQTRAVTTVSKLKVKNENYILWDNSNIIESYPGVTTPLTFSFISKSYEKAYKLFCGYMGVSSQIIKQNETVFANTLGLLNGRVYYNLKTWYQMLAMLPGYSVNARFMENMMGVKERFDIPDTYRLSKGKAWLRITKMAAGMYHRFLTLPQKRKDFATLLTATISTYKSIKLEDKTAVELMQLYLSFEDTLLNEWKAPLLNDFFAMIWFGLLQKRCKKYAISNNPNIHNDLLCGSSDIISTQPIHRSIALATTISSDTELKKLFTEENENAIWNEIKNNQTGKYVSLKKEIDKYIFDFGERCIGELKLETVSYTQQPSKFIKLLKSYVETGITADTMSGKTEEAIRAKAERELESSLQYKPYKKWKLKRTLQNARALVSARENLRYERTRAFGIVREIFSQIGKRFFAQCMIGNERDIFFLTMEEIFAFIDGTSVTQNIGSLIELRRSEFDAYRNEQQPSERFATYGVVYHNNDFFSTNKLETIEGSLKGIGCCPGIIRGTVRVVLNPAEISSLSGDILVTASTDPGWITIFPGASGIIVERGSVLSHSAIVSREMGKPCIVSVTGLLQTLATGDEIEMNGSTGEIKILRKHA